MSQDLTTTMPHQRWLLPVLLVVAVLALYGQTVGFGFSTWDDPIYLVNNPTVSELNGTNLKRIFTPGMKLPNDPETVPREMIYIPVTYLTWLLEIQVFGKNPHALHAGNVFLHLLNVLLVYTFLMQLVRNRVAAFGAALAFAVHPLQAEAVTWLMGRKDLLSAFFGLICLVSYQGFLDGRRRLYGISLFCFILAVFAKPSMIVLPGVFIILDYRHHKRWLGGEWGNKIPYLTVMLVAYFLHRQMPVQQDTPPSLLFRLSNVLWLVWHWVGKFLLLSRPNPIYGWPPADALVLILLKGVPAFAAFCGVCWYAWKKSWNWLWEGVLAFGICFLPAIQIVIEHRDFVTADRYGYFPLIGFFALLAAAPLALEGRVRKGFIGVFCAWVGVSFVLAFPAVRLWSDNIRLWDRVIEENPTYATARMNRANALAEQGRFAEAVSDYKRAMQLEPDSRQVRRNFAQMYLDWGKEDKSKLDEAAKLLESMVAVNPKDVYACMKLAEVSLFQGRNQEAARWYKNVLTTQPNHPVATHNLTMLLEKADLERLKENPNDIEAILNLGLIRAQQGRMAEALQYFTRGLALKTPHQADIYTSIARVHLQTGNRQKAKVAIASALQISPDHAAAKKLRDQLK